MDPNEALDHIRMLVADWQAGTPHEDCLDELAAQVQALDEWLSNAGFLPRDWQGETDPPRGGEHEAFHRRSDLPLPSVLCATCAPHSAVVPGVGLVAEPLGAPNPADSMLPEHTIEQVRRLSVVRRASD